MKKKTYSPLEVSLCMLVVLMATWMCFVHLRRVLVLTTMYDGVLMTEVVEKWRWE